MSNLSANLNLPFMAGAQAQKHIAHNEALELLDAITQLRVVAFNATVPPLSANDGEVWAIGAGPVNAWAGKDHMLAVWSNGGWLFITPKIGWRAALLDDLRVFSGTDWEKPALPDLQNLPGVGIGTSHDALNVLAVSGEASLFTNVGASHQMKINKAMPTDTASMLFQTGWSGRVEMGTAGSDDFAIKTSADGTTWATALTAQTSDGRVGLPAGADLPDGTDTAPGLAFATDPDTGLYRIGDGLLGFAVKGVERVRVTGAGMQVTGLVSGTAVTQSATDTTAERLLKVGDYGLGGTAGTKAYGTGNILGAVAQTGGVPTGAIIERGTNANGTYIRHADGTQICTHRLPIGSITFSGAGTLANPYRSNAQNWTYPASYVNSEISVTGTAEFIGPLVDGRRAAVFSHGPTNAVTCFNLQLHRWMQDSNPDEFYVNLVAIGRWF